MARASKEFVAFPAGQPWQHSPVRHESGMLPAVVRSQRNKDTATPATADDSMLGRLKKRKQRGGPRPVKVRFTKAMRLKRLESIPAQGKRDRLAWRRVHTPREKPENLGSVICGLCWEDDSHSCACGHDLCASYVPEELTNFVRFYASEKNPLLHAWDPEDQRELLDAIRAVHSHGASLASLFAVCALAGLLGQQDSVRALGPVAAAGNKEALEQAVASRHAAGLSVFRGGQRPGLSRLRVAGAVHELCAQAPEIPLAMAKLKRKELVFPTESARRDGLYAVCVALKRITDAKLVKGVSSYKAKRIFEMIQLACYGGVGDLYMHSSDLRSLHAVYPMPTNSISALRRIFPTAMTELSQRHGIRLLQKTLKPGNTGIGCIVAQLCFWTEQMIGKIQYLTMEEDDECSDID